MTTTVFVNGVTLTDAGWFNDQNRLNYDVFVNPADLAAVRVTMAASDTLAGTIEYADQSEMEAGTSNVRAVTPGRQKFHPSAAKAWVKFNTSGTIAASFNVTSVTDNGVGDFTVVFTVAFSSANYCAIVAVQDGSPVVFPAIGAQATGSCGITSRNSSNALTDSAGGTYYAAFFGDQ